MRLLAASRRPSALSRRSGFRCASRRCCPKRRSSPKRSAVAGRGALCPACRPALAARVCSAAGPSDMRPEACAGVAAGETACRRGAGAPEAAADGRGGLWVFTVSVRGFLGSSYSGFARFIHSFLSGFFVTAYPPCPGRPVHLWRYHTSFITNKSTIRNVLVIITRAGSNLAAGTARRSLWV